MTIAGRGANSQARVIAVAGKPLVLDQDKAAETITPGYIVNFDGNGDLINNTTGSKVVARMVALERDELNKDIDQTYVTGDQVKVGCFSPGQLGLLWLASGQNVAKGALLGPVTAGAVTADSTAGHGIAVAMEAINNTNGNASGFQNTGAKTAGDVRILVQFI